MSELRLACLFCEREDFDGTTAEAAAAAGWIEIWDRVNHASGAWWTHLGVCAECAKLKLNREDMVPRPRPPVSDPSELRPNEQRCGRCGAVDGMNFHVADDVWAAVASPKWRNERIDSVLCLACFDQLADEKGIDYSQSLSNVLFVGRSMGFDLAARRAY